jgi:trans-2-enoyl-CoA reductase
VLRDNAQLSEFVAATNAPKPRLALDAIGADSARRMLRILRFGSPLVCYGLRSSRMPAIDASLVMYQQISVHGFSLNQWFADNGKAAYLRMLESLAALTNRNKLVLQPTVLDCTSRIDGADFNALLGATVRGEGQAAGAAKAGVYPGRPKGVLLFGTEEQASAAYFMLTEQMRRVEAGLPPLAEANPNESAAPIAEVLPEPETEEGTKDADVGAFLERLGLPQVPHAALYRSKKAP